MFVNCHDDRLPVCLLLAKPNASYIQINFSSLVFRAEIWNSHPSLPSSAQNINIQKDNFPQDMLDCELIDRPQTIEN